MNNRTLSNIALTLLIALSLATSACATSTGALYGLSAAGVVGSGAMWYLAGEEVEALEAKRQYLEAALDTQTYDCAALKDTIAAVMIEKGYSYSYESTKEMHLSDWDYFKAAYDDQWNKIHDGGRRRMLFNATPNTQGQCNLAAFQQTLMNNAPEARKERDVELELAVLSRVNPTQFETIQKGATATYNAAKEDE